MSKNLISFNTRLEENLYKDLKITAAIKNITIQDLIASYIKDGLEKSKEIKND